MIEITDKVREDCCKLAEKLVGHLSQESDLVSYLTLTTLLMTMLKDCDDAYAEFIIDITNSYRAVKKKRAEMKENGEL